MERHLYKILIASSITFSIASAPSGTITIENHTQCSLLLQPVLTSSSELKLPQYIQPFDTGTGQFSFTSGWLTNPNQHAYAGYLVQCNQNLSALNLTLSIEESSQGGLEHFLSVSAADSDLIVFPQSSVPLSGAVAITVHSKSASAVFTLKETQDETPETQKVASE